LISPALVAGILAQYRLPRFGLHGVGHWARVLDNGRRLAAACGARLEVVELFALFHDSRRQNEAHDPDHGRRGAELAWRLRGWYALDDDGFDLLLEACAHHTDGGLTSDPTVGACWDADRLDLLRAGIHTDPRRLCTAAAREPRLLRWAARRAAEKAVPDMVEGEWGIAASDLP
jgi:uncharacterized protein